MKWIVHGSAFFGFFSLMICSVLFIRDLRPWLLYIPGLTKNVWATISKVDIVANQSSSDPESGAPSFDYFHSVIYIEYSFKGKQYFSDFGEFYNNPSLTIEEEVLWNQNKFQIDRFNYNQRPYTITDIDSIKAKLLPQVIENNPIKINLKISTLNPKLHEHKFKADASPFYEFICILVLGFGVIAMSLLFAKWANFTGVIWILPAAIVGVILSSLIVVFTGKNDHDEKYGPYKYEIENVILKSRINP